MTHLTDEIPRLLTGDANREEVLAAAEHLRGCPDCQQELVSAVVAHASLTSAHRFAPEIVTPVPAVDEEEPEGPLPDLSALFAQARAEAAVSTAPPSTNRRWRTVALAAAAAVVVGGTAAGVAELTSSSSSPTGTTVPLAAFQAGKAPAQARVVDRTMRIDATKLPRLDPQHFYEVWLTDKQRQHMWPLGAIGSDNKAQLPVPTSVMSRYAAIEVSVQRANETGYSGVSVLRGTYG